MSLKLNSPNETSSSLSSSISHARDDDVPIDVETTTDDDEHVMEANREESFPGLFLLIFYEVCFERKMWKKYLCQVFFSKISNIEFLAKKDIKPVIKLWRPYTPPTSTSPNNGRGLKAEATRLVE
jgi:hypothetical protein